MRHAERRAFATVMLLMLLFVVFTSLGCGGNSSLSSPRVYAKNPPPANEQAAASDSTATAKSDSESNKPLLNAPIEDKKKTEDTTAASTKATKPESTAKKSKTKSGSDQTHEGSLANAAEDLIYFGTVDVDDSASAVDDELWRQLDLAEEYHAMGVIANREASWEEAQYYFEKGLTILATLDVETDSTLTPEATKYSSILESLIADYRVTLRSLGDLTDDVSASVLIERFGELGSRLGDDTMQVFSSETAPVTYDLPIVMNDRVRSSIVYFQTVAKDAFYKYLRRSKKYTPMMRRIISEYGLPQDLVYVSLVESGYNPRAYSWARASGLWQFIASTGRLYKLNRNWWYDERRDPVKATHAACQFLRDLYKQFGSWELAMAAYNGGPGRVGRQIKKQKTIDFWKLNLRRQTMDYVPLIMAATIIAKNPEKYGFTDFEFEPEIVWDEVSIDKCLELAVVAREIGCTNQQLQDLNPELLRKYTPPNTKNYKLKIPVGTSQKFLAAYDGMPSPKETSWVRHKIRRGETVSTIAARYGVSQYAILEANNISRRSRIYAGKELIVPVPLDRDYWAQSKKKSNESYSAKNSIYTVRAGDTMWDIARAFGTTVNSLRGINYIERGSRIYVGQKLKIPSTAKNFKEKNTASGKSDFYASTSTKSSGSSKSGGGKVKTYSVRAGDTLWDIARQFGTTTGKIRRLNDLGRSSRIYPGQKLRITSGDINYVIHKVKRGESLARIAKKYRTTIVKIRAANSIDDPNLLRVGERLKILVK